ncbi:MAG: hypothetical protein B6I24_01695 [Bacteroidetes bacterium 4572_128]|nr:MAG: hypothetical protein B6I24_01695 [Bacteroidetes bacterium 4572_128]
MKFWAIFEKKIFLTLEVFFLTPMFRHQTLEVQKKTSNVVLSKNLKILDDFLKKIFFYFEIKIFKILGKL